MLVAPLTITTSDPVAKFLLSDPTIFGSAGLEVLAPKWGILIPGDMTIIQLMNEQLKLLSDYFGLLTPLKQQAKKEVVVLDGVIDTDF